MLTTIDNIHIDKALEEARKRKPLMEPADIERLLSAKRRGRVFSPWVLLPISGLMLIAIVFAVNFRTKAKSHAPIQAVKAIAKVTSPVAEPAHTDLKTKIEVAEAQLPKISLPKSKPAIKKEFTLVTSDAPGEQEESAPQAVTINTSAEGASQRLNAAPPDPEPVRKEALGALTLRGWRLAYSGPGEFSYGADKDQAHTGRASAFISSKKTTFKSAWLTQDMSAETYAGKRIKMSAWVKCKNPGKKAWAGIFMNVRGYDFKVAGYDNMYDKSIDKTTDWVKCEIVMDIPKESRNISFGLYKVYAGEAWIDDIRFEEAPDAGLHFLANTEAFDTSLVLPDAFSKATSVMVETPVSLDFEDAVAPILPDHWELGQEKQHFSAYTDAKKFHGGEQSACLESTSPKKQDWNTLLQVCKARNYINKRMQLTAWIKSEGLKDHAAFVFRIDEYTGRSQPGNIQQQVITGDNKWRKIEMVLDIPETATYFSYGLYLEGKGKVWMDDLSIKEIPRQEPPHNTPVSNRNPVNLDFEE